MRGMFRSNLSVVVVRDRPSAGGGICNYYDAISKHLENEVHFVDVGRPHSFYKQSCSRLTRYTVLRLLSDWFSLVLKIFRVRPDLVHVNPGVDEEFRALPREAVNILIALMLRKRVLVFWRGWPNSWVTRPEFPGGNKGFISQIYRKASAHIVLATRFKEDLLRWGFNTPIHVETTVASDDILAASPADPADRNPKHLLYLSRVEVAKGVFELLDAYRILKAKDPEYSLTIAGDGPDLEALRGYASTLGLADLSFTGFVSGDAKVESYRQGGIFCFLSYTEGMPNAVLEAMAMGLPLVSSDAGGLRDILKDGQTGFIVQFLKGTETKKRFNPVEIADAIERLANNPELYARIARHNAAYASERFSAPVVAKRLESIYRDVIMGDQIAVAENSIAVK